MTADDIKKSFREQLTAYILSRPKDEQNYLIQKSVQDWFTSYIDKYVDAFYLHPDQLNDFIHLLIPRLVAAQLAVYWKMLTDETNQVIGDIQISTAPATEKPADYKPKVAQETREQAVAAAVKDATSAKAQFAAADQSKPESKDESNKAPWVLVAILGAVGVIALIWWMAKR